MTSYLFGGVWCASSSIFALRHTVEDFPTSSLIKEIVYKSFYVDDLLKAVPSKEQVMEVIIDTKEVLRQGGFNLAKFVVNNAELQQFIPVEDTAKEMKDITSGIYSKALGIKWDVFEDTLYFSNLPKQVESGDDVTKRSMLSKLSAIYDPLGLITPILMQGKMIFQEATLKKITIPRLELLAAVLAIKLDLLVRRELNVTILESHFWTDSQIILAYIQSKSKRFKIFVANRVSLIREHSTPEQWKYIKGEENPADILSRGCTLQAISQKWFHGPKFISDFKHAWPT